MKLFFVQITVCRCKGDTINKSRQVIHDGYILLPQTTLRLWGIPTLDIHNIFQLKIPIRSKNDKLFEKSYYEMNRMILEIIKIYKIAQIEKNQLIIFNPKNSLVDCQILNLINYFPNLTLPKGIKILDYSSLGHRSLVLSDLRFPIEFSRAILRNIRFSSKFSPNLIWHWDDYGKDLKNSTLNFGWLNMFVETDLIKKFAMKFLKHNLNLFPEISKIKENDGILIISPDLFHNSKDISLELEILLDSNSIIKRKFQEAEYIIIKQHRVSEIDLPDYFEVRGKLATVMNSPLSRVLPIEILIFGLSNSFLISVPSSALYSNNQMDYYEISTEDIDSKKAYGLNMRRKTALTKKLSK